MEGFIKVLTSTIPFLNQYPIWVRVCAVLWILASAAIVVILILVPRSVQKGDSEVSQGQRQSGIGNIQAGRDVTIINQTGGITESLLEVTYVGFTLNGEFDVMVRNLGDTDLIIHSISIKKLEETEIRVRPMLRPSAKYNIPVDDIPVGEIKTISVSHIVPARSADRFLIGLKSIRVYVLEVTINYNKGQSVSFKKRTWNFKT